MTEQPPTSGPSPSDEGDTLDTPDPQANQRRVTIYDVAHEVGVSPSTVSRAFARPGRVNADTAERIRLAAERLGYRTSVIPRSERDEATKILAFVAADATNPVYTHMMRSFQNEAHEAGYSTILLDSQENSVLEQDLINRIVPVVDGVALVASRLSDSAIAQVAKVTPLVAVNRVVQGTTSVVPDTRGGLRRAVQYLESLGHERLTYLAGPEASWMDGTRWRAVTEACKSFDMPVRRIGPCVPSVRGGLEASQRWRDNPTTAVMAFNDIMAIGFMKGVQALGMRVPDDVSVVGIDNSISAVLNTPTLTSVATSATEIGQSAACTLIHQVTRRSARLNQTFVVPVTLVQRDSVSYPHSPVQPVGQHPHF
ncbi:LacI family DNA-binding transcriptional regulator [Schaalia sp. 19OD2882]|uniref:LacI family DNA-binding transcriptional regulator n=1 Tax=Schaalia sp. 19OD2882 TaxID=2794089 RepID=UPI001C1ED101|nr:LacI family DNA-binding transcriptional regulator [Schaalia sp. 19OD2882]QWW19986.1 LacI family DNA-binding transcriptional regulator [Schaalia sp. 19OD2882]